jgi:hypothetical protein
MQSEWQIASYITENKTKDPINQAPLNLMCFKSTEDKGLISKLC